MNNALSSHETFVAKHIDGLIKIFLFYVYVYVDVLVASTLFAATNRASTSKHSLSVISSSAHLQRYTPLHDFFVDQLQLLARQLQALLDAVPVARAYAAFSASVERSVVWLERLFIAHVSSSSVSSSSISLSLPPPLLDETFLGERFSRSLDANFMARIVTSMFQTQCSCIVAGSSDINSINTMLRTLALFVEPSDLARCALARAPTGIAAVRAQATTTSSRPAPTAITAQYVPNLLLQGVVDIDSALAAQLGDDEGAPGSADAGLRDETLLMSLSPTTLVLLDSGQVRQTARTDEYARVRADCQRHMVSAIATAASTAPDTPPTRWHNKFASYSYSYFVFLHSQYVFIRNGMFQVVREPAPCVVRMLEYVKQFVCVCFNIFNYYYMNTRTTGSIVARAFDASVHSTQHTTLDAPSSSTHQTHRKVFIDRP